MRPRIQESDEPDGPGWIEFEDRESEDTGSSWSEEEVVQAMFEAPELQSLWGIERVAGAGQDAIIGDGENGVTGEGDDAVTVEWKDKVVREDEDTVAGANNSS